MIKYIKITDISVVNDNDIDTHISKKPISKVPIQYRYINIGDISTIFSTFRRYFNFSIYQRYF